MPNHEYQITVIFDVTAPSRQEAAACICDGLTMSATGPVLGFRPYFERRTVARHPGVVLESWWFPEVDLKHLDGNDNDPLHLEHDEPEDR